MRQDFMTSKREDVEGRAKDKSESKGECNL